MKISFSEHFFLFYFFFSYLLNLEIIRPPNTLILPFLSIQWASYLVFGTEWARRFTQLMLSLIFWRKKNLVIRVFVVLSRFYIYYLRKWIKVIAGIYLERGQMFFLFSSLVVLVPQNRGINKFPNKQLPSNSENRSPRTEVSRPSTRSDNERKSF